MHFDAHILSNNMKTGKVMFLELIEYSGKK